MPWAEPAGDPLEQPGLLSYWAHWDGAWYSQIAVEGYGEMAAPASTAFFPLYPMLMRLGTVFGGGSALWGVLISLVATPFALFFLYRIAERLYESKRAVEMRKYLAKMRREAIIEWKNDELRKAWEAGIAAETAAAAAPAPAPAKPATY